MESGIECHIKKAPETSVPNGKNNSSEVPDQQPIEDSTTPQENYENLEAAADNHAKLNAKTPDQHLPPLQPQAKKPRQKRRIIHRETAKRESTPIRYLGDEDAAKIEEEIALERTTNQNGKEWSSSSTSEVKII